MIAVDATPLAGPPRRGVARALLHVLRAWEADPPEEGVVLLAPRALPPDVPRLGGHVHPRRPLRPRRFRARVRRLLSDAGARVLYVPWSAFPRCHVPVVATVHELPFVRLGPVEGRWRTAVHRWWLGRNVRECARVVVPSEATRDDLLALHPDAAPRVVVVEHGFDPEPWATAALGVKPASPPTCVVVGTGAGAAGWRKKGLDVLARALPDLAGAGLRVVVVGEVPRRMRRLVDVVRDPDDRRVRQLVASARVLAHPARSEGFGFPLLEAMAAGVPVVAAAGGAVPEVVGDAARLVPVGDASAFASAVRTVAGDETERARLVQAGRARARAHPLAAAADRLLAVLRSAREDS